MKKIYMCMSMPQGTAYVGGVATIVSQYMQNEKEFFNRGYDIELFNYKNDRIEKIKNSKIRNLIEAHYQKKALINKIGENFNDYIHIHSSRGWLFFKDLILCRKVKRETNAKTIITVHFADTEKILYSNIILKKIELKLIEKYVDKMILLSYKTKKEFISRGIKENKMSVSYTFHNFVSPQKTLREDTVNLLFVGSLDKRKGILDLLKVLIELQEESSFMLHICGQITDSSLENDFNNYLEKLKGRVIVHGYVSGEKKQKIFENADILILPSYGEGMPIVIMEAIATGTAIISTTVGAIPEIVKESNGILNEPGDLKGIKKALQLLINNRKLLEEIKSINYEEGEKYSLIYNIKEICSIYDTI